MERQIHLPLIHKHPYFCFAESVGWYKNFTNHIVKRQKNEMHNFSIHVVISGKGYLKSNGTTYVLQQGDAFLYFPSEEQFYHADKENPWEVLWVHFNGGYLKEFFIENGFHLSNVWTIKLWANIKKAIITLLEEVEQFTILHPATISSLTYAIISEFVSQAEPLTSNKGYGLYDKIIALLPKMRELSSKPFELKYWADELNISTYYFCKIFKKATAMTPTGFIMLCRLQNSKQLLIEKREWTVKQIALEVGYPSICYFGRLFLQNEGVTPSEYRNKLL